MNKPDEENTITTKTYKSYFLWCKLFFSMFITKLISIVRRDHQITNRRRKKIIQIYINLEIKRRI